MKSQKSKVKSQKYKLKLKIYKITTFAFLIVIFNFAFLILHLDKAEASALSLGVYPPITYIQALPNDNIKTPLSITNNTNNILNLKIYFKEFVASNKENGQPLFLDKNSSNFTKLIEDKKITVNEDNNQAETIEIGPKQTKKLSLNINLDKNETISDYYFSILFVTSKESNIEEIKDPSLRTALTNISLAVATNVILTAKENLKPNAAIEEFSTSFFKETGPVPFTIRVKNTSNHVIQPQGIIVIKNMFNQVIGKVDLSPVYILKDSTRESSEKQNALLWNEKPIFGFYTATLSLTLSSSGPVFTKNIYFIGAPIKTLGIVFVILLIIVILKLRIEKHRETI